MLTVADQYRIRKAYYTEKQSQRAIARALGYSRNTVKKAIAQDEPFTYRQEQERPAPVLGPYKAQLQAWVEANRGLPRKQRYTAHKMYELIREQGYAGAESTVRYYVGQLRKASGKQQVYIPLDYDAGVDMQMDWGEAVVKIGGEVTTVKLFVLRWCYSRKGFVAAYPSEKQECFLDGHVRAFHYFGGTPQRIIYDNLKPAVLRILQGRNREEQATFLAFRNHYVFESRYCNPASGHEKGGVENDVGYVRRNFLAGCPAFATYDDLNAHLLTQCQQTDQRTVHGQPHTVAEAWQVESPTIHGLPAYDMACCNAREQKVNKYSQVLFETNRYSVPTDQAYRTVTVRAYPFHLDILYQDRILARHDRSYGRGQDISDPLHYLPLLEQRPGAFEHARPMRQLRQHWDPVYEQLLTHLQQRLTSTRAIREFVRILSLHRTYPPEAVTAAVHRALACGSAHLDNVTLCLHQALNPDCLPPQLDLSAQPALAQLGQQPIDLTVYDQFLWGETHVD
nr:IS21 family transposase [Anaerolineae bacterium]